MGDNPVNILLDKLSECEWIIKEDSIWKIDSLAMPKFDKVALPQIELEPSDEA